MTRTTPDIDRSLLPQALAQRTNNRPPFAWLHRDLDPALVDFEDKDAVWAILDEGYHVGEEEIDAHNC